MGIPLGTAALLALLAAVPPRVAAEDGPGSTWKYYDNPRLEPDAAVARARQALESPSAFAAEVNAQVASFSARLERQIRSWLAGEAPSLFPEGFFSRWVDNAKTHDWHLVAPGEVAPERQWYVIPAHDPSAALYQFSPDPHATYLKALVLAPLGSTLEVEGEFPHARFMDFQIVAPVDPLFPQEAMGEVPLVDVDIEPDPGHVNPFRLGGDRDAAKRRYHVTFALAAGNAAALNPDALRPPAFRAAGNTRVGGPFMLTSLGNGTVIVPAVLWLRYYAPDSTAGPLGGVPLPRLALRLSTGEGFWTACDMSRVVELAGPVPRIAPSPPRDPYPFMGADLGWFRMYDILLSHMEAKGYRQAQPWGALAPAAARATVRRNFRLMFNRGAEVSPPGDHASGPTCCPYNSYLVRPMSLGGGKVVVVAGRLPSFPATRAGQRTMTAGQVRFFSLTHQLGADSEHNRGRHGTPYGSLMDDEIVVDRERDYVIVLSRGEDRPSNARPELGVTWQEWGEPAAQTLVLRWLSVMPDWHLPEHAPDLRNLPWRLGAWSQDGYDPELVGRNRPGLMGPYHPVLHYLSRQEFEGLGSDRAIRAADLPPWRDDGALPGPGSRHPGGRSASDRRHGDARPVRVVPQSQGGTR